jgi:hypothetical protein
VALYATVIAAAGSYGSAFATAAGIAVLGVLPALRAPSRPSG